jgi:DNA-binding protein Fis
VTRRGEVDDAPDERTRIERALEQCKGNQTLAAALLGVSRRTLVSRLTQYGMPRPRKK